ncbi:TetR/AcrR family transcriptional regulator [Actinosynnema sp. NPDC047251]|uniref:Transcriptional regulator, TetR family n=1 Tax=Saccharothrix espanaensis (strain ATCC 51144 / DSM 44229 / JCM 9112 / NBRC 15066 / NRRL 15764) TaxID=1179773 RepID=K0JX44_SACES|nr:TetR/AcrR family transcriptional regulator [Saccharothrix espanaensis]CCH30586.1 Transcriptional regulator, TetR family [Saccharothrix espanaensis DSM 44229]
MPTVRRPAAQTREHVLAIAHDLFYWNGIRAVGVDRIAAEAAIAPTTLYRLFASKDDLVAAYLERADERHRSWFLRASADDGRGVRERILAVFDELVVQVQPERSRGCPFLMALAEFPDPALPAHRNAIATKAWVHGQFTRLAQELAETGGVADAEALGAELALVMEGVYATVQSMGVGGPARRSRALVELLLAG